MNGNRDKSKEPAAATTTTTTTAEMLSFAAPAPIFSGWDHRPPVSSPLSSSPIRASSPLSPVDNNTLPQRQSQSSPIRPTPKFKFASRPTRPNPLVRKREEAQETRRRQFLQNVRQKADDKAWERRDIEGQFLKTNWLASIGRLSYDAPSVSEADIEDAAAFSQGGNQTQGGDEDDEMMMDGSQEQAELEAMVASYEEQDQQTGQEPPSPTISDDEYDELFAELASQEASHHAGNREPNPDLMEGIDDGGGAAQ